MLPRAVIGVPIHNGGQHVEQSLRSLFGQTYENASFVVVDDASTDRSPEILAGLAAGVPARLERSEASLGLVGAWRRTFELALEAYPDARYFAWGSDHDVWEPEWLSRLVEALEARPQAVFAWPQLDAIDEYGAPYKRGFTRFDTFGMSDPLDRIRRFARARRAGDMVYGLYRVEAMRRCGPFPFILQPDRLFLARLILEGEFVQVPEVLWHRRYRQNAVASMSRQRRSLWGGRPPLWTLAPWRLQHWFWLLRELCERPLAARLRIAAIYAVTTRWVTASRARKDRMMRRKRWRRRWSKKWRHRLGRVRSALRRVSGGTGQRDDLGGRSDILPPMFGIRRRSAKVHKQHGRAASPEASADMPEHELLRERRLATAVVVDQPLVLVSQVQRSGGTLLSQLFDAHPQVHAHPYELKIGFPNKLTWPKLEPEAGPERWWEMLSESDVLWAFRDGYTKYSPSLLNGLLREERPELFPFLLPIGLQRDLFFGVARRLVDPTPRRILDCYMTSYFNAWLDNQNLYATPKRIVTGFTPRMIAVDGNVDAFFGDYPDGTLISLVREPRSWYASALRHHQESYADIDAAIDVWRASTEAAASARERYGDRVVVLTYERLVTDTERVMHALAGRLRIDFLPVLEKPTFNGMPIRADSAFEVAAHGVITTAVNRRDELDRATAARIGDELTPLYEAVVASQD